MDKTTLQISKEITSIDFSDQQIDDARVQAIAKNLEQETKWISINFCNNKITAKGFEAIAKMLEKKTTVFSIDLSHNPGGDAGAQAFAEFLKKNTTLHAINLKASEMGSAGIKAIAVALEENTTLHSIDLSGNEISAEDILAIVKMFKKNTTLTSLGFFFENKYRDFPQLTSPLKRNQTIFQHKTALETLNSIKDALKNQKDAQIINVLLENIEKHFNEIKKIMPTATQLNEISSELFDIISHYSFCFSSQDIEKFFKNLSPEQKNSKEIQEGLVNIRFEQDGRRLLIPKEKYTKHFFMLSNCVFYLSPKRWDQVKPSFYREFYLHLSNASETNFLDIGHVVELVQQFIRNPENNDKCISLCAAHPELKNFMDKEKLLYTESPQKKISGMRLN